MDESANPPRPNYSRSAHRARSHESAHAQDIVPPGDVPTHELISNNAPELITSAAQLAEFIDHLRAEKSFAYDSEFIGELTYVPKLCLIQAATTRRIGLIDPLAPDLDLTPFWQLLGDASVEKIVHAGQQDVEPVVRHTGQPARNVFDTQIAAGFVGMAYPTSLSKLVMELIGAKLGKGLTFTHWDQRPLSAMQLRYAADDVRYLPAARQVLAARMEKLGHTQWAKEEFEELCDPAQFGFDPETYYLRVRGASGLQPQQLAVLRELTIWRDSAARQHNVPPRAFLKDEILVDLSRSPVKTLDKLGRVRGLPRPVEHAHGSKIVEATLQGLAVPRDAMPQLRTIEQTPTERFAADGLWAATQCLCLGRSIDPSLVTSRQEMSEFYRFVQTNSEEPDIHFLKGWRREAIASVLMNMIKGKSGVSLSWDEKALLAQVKSVQL